MIKKILLCSRDPSPAYKFYGVQGASMLHFIILEIHILTSTNYRDHMEKST